MKFIPTEIPELILIEPKVLGDSRGYFMETYREPLFQANGIKEKFVQDNMSRSVRGTLRGLHYQLDPHAQGKLVRVLRGAVYDVAVDIRRGSPAFGKWIGVELSEENKLSLWIPAGFAHGFYVLSDIAEFTYKCTAIYTPHAERGIVWNDPDINIKWPIVGDDVVLSEKDKSNPLLQDADYNFIYYSRESSL
ncbi:dTDP-4-dehydrorhamnose 3,5-epimerase [candidate division KSB1 bacterium]|nr:dTDP-4-dehydrorhamnose 3,5-epimerase [candidate division KSB1 bacterium]RQW02767.1 MAG: dTDP-4-dehydrorhamnose 3,5-epimerase [candidate division KSB1 bacterium]